MLPINAHLEIAYRAQKSSQIEWCGTRVQFLSLVEVYPLKKNAISSLVRGDFSLEFDPAHELLHELHEGSAMGYLTVSTS